MDGDKQNAPSGTSQHQPLPDDDIWAALGFGEADARMRDVPNTDARMPARALEPNSLPGHGEPAVWRGIAVESAPARGFAEDDAFALAGSADMAFADMAFAPASKPTEFAQAAAVPAPAAAAFAAPKMQPFYEDDTVTQFTSTEKPEQICDALLAAMKANDCMYDVNRDQGVIKLTAFVDHSRVSATVRIYLKAPGSYLVHYGRNFGDRIPATRLFFTLANESKLIELQVPRLLRRRAAPRACCAAAAAAAASGAGSSEAKATSGAAEFQPTATTVFVEMLGSVFAEEALVGAQGLARACCCTVSAAPYVPHLRAIVSAFREHQSGGCAGHLVSRDVIACLADVIARVGEAAARADAETRADAAVEPMLKCAAAAGGDAECMRASLRALTILCRADATLRSRVLDARHRELVAAAVALAAQEQSEIRGTPVVRAAAQTLQAVLGL